MFMQVKYSRLERVLEGDSRYLQPPELEIDDLARGTEGEQRRISFCYDNHCIHSPYLTSKSD